MKGLTDYTDKAIMKLLLSQVQQMNPWIRIGEKIDGPCAAVAGGKNSPSDKFDPPKPDNLIDIQNIPTHVVPPAPPGPRVSVAAQTVKLKMQDIETFRTAGMKKLDFHLTKPTWLYPYKVEIPNRSWLEDYNLGDTVSISVLDPNTFQVVYVETPLTQQMIDDNSDVYFRFALSDQ
jgi:hypothetical protein